MIVDILSSSFAVAAYFDANPLPRGQKVYLVNESGVAEELRLQGIEHFGAEQHAMKEVALGESPVCLMEICMTVTMLCRTRGADGP